MKKIVSLFLAICILIGSTLSFYGCSDENLIILNSDNWSEYLEVMTSVYMDGNYLVCEAEAESVSPLIKFNNCIVRVIIVVWTIKDGSDFDIEGHQSLLELRLNIGGGGSASERIYVGSNRSIFTVKERSVYSAAGFVDVN